MTQLRIFLIPVFFLGIFSAKAQETSLTFLGGLNVTDMSVKYETGTTDIENTYKMKLAFHGGVLLDYVFSKDRKRELSVESGLVFDSKGVNQDLVFGDDMQQNTWNLYYMDVPVYFKYIKKLRSRDKVYVGIGPYLGVGLFGSKVFGGNSEKIKWGSGNDFKRLDYGLSAKFGLYFYNGLNISTSYDYGFFNVSALDAVERKNRSLRLSLGYTLKFDD